MRYESTDFMKSHRQWQESRESKMSVDGNLTREYGIIGENGNQNSPIYRTDKRKIRNESRSGIINQCPKENASTDFSSNKDRDHFPTSLNSSQPADLSKKELEQLTRMKQKRTQQQRDSSLEMQRTMAALQYEQRTENIGCNSAEALLSARNKVKQSNSERGLKSSLELDGLLFSMLPAQMWFGDFLNDSQDAFKNVHRRMLLEYRNNYM